MRTDNWQIGDDRDPVWAETAHWAAGETDSRPILDRKDRHALTYFTVRGPVDLSIQWGNSGVNILTARAPLAWTVPGELVVRATPITTPQSPISCTVAWADATYPASYPPRTQHTAGDTIPDAGGWATGLNAATMLVGGVVVNLIAGRRVPLMPGSSVVAGDVIVEYLV